MPNEQSMPRELVNQIRSQQIFAGEEAVISNLIKKGLIPDPIKKGGFFDLPTEQKCNHPEHEPPTHIHIPQGKGYRHVCPGCGKVVDVIPPQSSL